MALHLLGELITRAPQLTLEDWEPALLFEVGPAPEAATDESRSQ